MADSSASALILFIAAVAVAAGVAGMLTTTVEDISSAIDVRGDQVTEEIRTDISIISDTGSDAVYNETDYDGDGDTDGVVSLYVKNTGSAGLPADPASVDSLIDGEYHEVERLSEPDSDTQLTSWRPGEVAEVEIVLEDTLAAGEEYRVLINVKGNEDVVTIYV